MSAPLPATAEQVEAAWHDTKLAQVLYHDWEAQTYDEKWSISFDQRCIDYARDRFVAVAGAPGRAYGDALEVGCGTGFFSLNLRLSGLIDQVHVTDISPGMVEAARRNGDRLGIPVQGPRRRRRAAAVRRRRLRPRGRPRGGPPCARR